MAGKRKPRLRGIMEPILVREPVLLRLCSGFADNLTLILRTAFIIGALFLVQDLQVMVEKRGEPLAGIQPQQSAPVPPAVAPTATKEPVFSDGVKHAFNCTFTEYRNKHFDECVHGPSRVYKRPGAEDDDTGQIFYATPVLYAGLDNRVSTQ